MTDDDEMAFEPGPTALDLLEQMATGRLPKSLYRGVVHAVHLRVPVHIWAQMSAIANLGNNSYNADEHHDVRGGARGAERPSE